MKKTTNDKKDKQIENVKRELTKRGYILELQVYRVLSKNKWDVELNPDYWDVEINSHKKSWAELEEDVLSFDHGKTIRTIDLIAEKELVLKSKSFKST